MAFYQQALAKSLKDKLKISGDKFGVLFDVNLFNNIMNSDFNEESLVENTYTTEFKRQVPTMITNINGEYIPIPNLNGTNNSLEIIFDLAVDDMTGQDEEKEFETVNYQNTLLAIDDFKNTLLANYYPLGDSNIMLGGEDSTIVSTSTVSLTPKFIYIKFIPKNNDNENILNGDNNADYKLSKNATNIIFTYGSNTLTIPYYVNVTNEITLRLNDTGMWSLINNFDDSDYSSIGQSSSSYSNFEIGFFTGIECILERLVIDEDYHITIDDVVSPVIDFNSFDNKDSITNLGVSTGFTTTINNCILFGSDGNAVFQVYPLAVVGEYQGKNGINYHQFSLQLEAMIGDNFIFGNNFEYYIDNIRVYPVDRAHTFALDTQGRQGINSNIMKFIGGESTLDWTQSFFYQPTKQLTSLVKKITTGDKEQNKLYTLKVQYPFWNKEYEVIVEGGGINTDINSITTFSLQFKLADDILATEE